jgi:hypothetical protein
MRRPLSLYAFFVFVAVIVSACQSSPAAPTSPAAAAAATGDVPVVASGRAIDALTGAPVASVAISLDGGVPSTTAADGCFRMAASGAGLHTVTVSGPGVVPRETQIRTPGDAAVSLIPTGFDVATFDQMFRDGGALHRWTSPPALVIVDAVLQFTSLSDSTFTALDEHLTADERASIEADLTWGLPQATGNAFTAFSSVTVESPAPGTPVNFFSRDGRIVVARFRGLSQATGYWGYGRWARRSNDVTAGAVMVDRDFDAAAGPHVRSLRVHELGHALGYCHVTKRVSFMNSAATSEPNDFDRDAARIAFQRPPGNQSPDRDPASVSSLSGAGLTWGTITP